MSKLIILVVNLICLFSASVGLQQPGQCDPNIQVMTGFDLQRFAVEWYDIESYGNTHQSGTCNTARYTYNSDGTLTVRNSHIINEALFTASGTATLVPSTDGSAKLLFTVGSSTTPIDYWILTTDYDRYALVYACRNVNAVTREIFSWKLSRTRELSSEVATIINNAIAAVPALDPQQYITRDQSPNGCFYYPEFAPGSVIELPGSCPTISGVAAFDRTAYLGTWYEVARYPQPTQQGQCNRATYDDAGNGVISVVNRQVVSEALATISGTATVAADGTGRLQVTFNIGGVPTSTDLHILATDYVSYSLVYTCSNLSNGYRRVGSWKLSRTRTLSPQADIVINNIINTTQGLNQAYYQPTSQSDASCFYYPVFDGSETSIELPGTCETAAITGVAGFRPLDYVGTWYEAARYPQPTQQGQCNRATYGDAGNGVISVVNRQVVNEALATISGTATVAADGTGRLQITFNFGGVPTTTDIYVLATDYNGYSLVYSCTDLPNGNRQVGSWKLSRRREGLTAVENTILDTVISNTQGLNNNYYRSTSQSDASCFYYPVFETLPNVIELPGPCETVTGVAQFNTGAYFGTWYEVARYPQPTQQGQCNRATYGDAGNGVISVVNRQVVSEALATISGTATVAADGTGRLQVTFNIGGVPTPTDLYVLATDYNGYSLVYSCTNLNNGNRQVGSWKLSRSPTLTPAASTEINTVIDNTQALREDYYQTTSQSDDACFHYPIRTDATSEIVLPGQCNSTITGVSSFNISRFARTWYHIQQYDQLQGNCSGTRLTYNEETSTFNVINFRVVDGELDQTEGTGRLNSTDGSGNLLIVTQGTNANETSENLIHILDTDYTGYAIAYSCENVNAAERRVRVWQLSTNRTMTTAGVTAVNALTQNMRELHAPYFLQVPHNEECPEPSSAILFKSSIIVIFVCTILQVLW